MGRALLNVSFEAGDRICARVGGSSGILRGLLIQIRGEGLGLGYWGWMGLGSCPYLCVWGGGVLDRVE